jgi:citrate lyase alpha subunit
MPASSIFLGEFPSSQITPGAAIDVPVTATGVDFAAAIQDINARSVAAYLRRQALEQQRQQLQQATILCDQELIALDGELRAITALQQKAGR